MSWRTDLPDAPGGRHQEQDAYLVENDVNDDWADESELSSLVGLYEQDHRPFTVQRYLAGEVD